MALNHSFIHSHLSKGGGCFVTFQEQIVRFAAESAFLALRLLFP
jgi:hypothetical protein